MTDNSAPNKQVAPFANPLGVQPATGAQHSTAPYFTSATVVSVKDPTGQHRLQVRLDTQFSDTIKDLGWTTGLNKAKTGVGDTTIGWFRPGDKLLVHVDGQIITPFGLHAQRDPKDPDNPEKVAGPLFMRPKETANKRLNKENDGNPSIMQGHKGTRHNYDKSTTNLEFALSQAAGKVHALYPQLPTIGHVMFNGGNNILDVIKQYDPSNLSGAVQPALQMMQQLLNNTNPMAALQGIAGGSLYNLINQALQLINKKGGGKDKPPPPKIGDPCALSDPNGNSIAGTYQYDDKGNIACAPPKQPVLTS